MEKGIKDSNSSAKSWFIITHCFASFFTHTPFANSFLQDLHPFLQYWGICLQSTLDPDYASFQTVLFFNMYYYFSETKKQFSRESFESIEKHLWSEFYLYIAIHKDMYIYHWIAYINIHIYLCHYIYMLLIYVIKIFPYSLQISLSSKNHCNLLVWVHPLSYRSFEHVNWIYSRLLNPRSKIKSVWRWDPLSVKSYQAKLQYAASIAYDISYRNNT